MPLRALRFAFVAALLVLATAPAHAAGDADLEQAKQAFEQADKDYALGKFNDALKLYAHAYDLKPLPGFLFNIGQCHRNLGNWERASFFYQGYLAREPKAKNRDKVLTLIDQMNQKVREQEELRRANATQPTNPNPNPNPVVVPVGPNTTQTPTNPVVTQPENGNPTTLVAVPAVPIVPPTQPQPAATPLYKKWWLWTIVGVVVVGAGAGIAAAALDPSVSTGNLSGSLGGPIDASH